MDNEILQQVLPYVGGLGAVILVLALMFKQEIKIWLTTGRTCQVTLKVHEKVLEDHRDRIAQCEKAVAILPMIQEELKAIRDCLDKLTIHVLSNGKH